MLTVLTVVIVLFTIVLFHELGHFLAAKAKGVQVDEFGIGFPPRLLAMKRGETTYSFNALLVGAFVRMGGEDSPFDSRGLQEKSPATRALIGAAGPASNLVLAFILFTASFLLPFDVVTGGEGIKIASVAASSPAEMAGIMPGDVVLGLDDNPVGSFEELRQGIEASLDREVTLLIRRGGGNKEIGVTPRSRRPAGEGALGIALTWEKLQLEKRSYSFGEAVAKSAGMFTSLPSMLTELINSIRENASHALIGPVGAAQITGEVAKYGLSPLLSLIASLSLGLALFNMVPLPPLDGGGIAISAVEAFLKNRRLSSKRRQFIYGIGTALLITLIFTITYNDILRLIRGEKILP